MAQVRFQQFDQTSVVDRQVPRARSTLEFAGLDDHARMPARFFGRMVASDAAGLIPG